MANDPTRTIRTSTLLLIGLLVATLLVAYSLVNDANQRAHVAEGTNDFLSAACN